MVTIAQYKEYVGDNNLIEVIHDYKKKGKTIMLLLPIAVGWMG